MRTIRSFIVLIVLAGSLISVADRASAAPLGFCGITVVTDVKVTRDLVCAGKSGIVVGANGITIDINGHKITGDETSGHHGVENKGAFSDVIVKNGTLTKFDIGVYADSGSPTVGLTNQMRIDHMLIKNNLNGGVWVWGNFARVRSSIIRSNDGGSEIEIDGDRAVVEFTEVSGVRWGGISIDGDWARVHATRVINNGTDGISIRGELAVVTSSQSFGNLRDGIYIEGGGARVKASRASRNGNDGVEVSGDGAKIGKLPGGPVADKNHADDNGFGDGLPDLGQGFWVHDFTTGPIGRNTADGNDDPAECNPATLC